MRVSERKKERLFDWWEVMLNQLFRTVKAVLYVCACVVLVAPVSAFIIGYLNIPFVNSTPSFTMIVSCNAKASLYCIKSKKTYAKRACACESENGEYIYNAKNDSLGRRPKKKKW